MRDLPLPPSFLGTEHALVLDHVVASTVVALPLPADAALTVEAWIEPEPYAQGYRIGSEFGFLGLIDAAEAADFPSLAALRANRCHARTLADITLIAGNAAANADATHARDVGRDANPEVIEVALLVGPDEWLIPRNNQPAGSVLLAAGRGLPVETAPAVSADVSAEQIAAFAPGAYVVTLRAVGQRVLVELEDQILGACVEDALLLGIVSEAQAAGAVVAARMYVDGGRLAIDIPLAGVDLFSPPLPELTHPAASLIPADPKADWHYDTDATPLLTPAPAGKQHFNALPAPRRDTAAE